MIREANSITTTYTLHHVLVKVADVGAASEDFRKLGFNVLLGGTPEEVTNAFIHFQDGSFLEFFTLELPSPKTFTLLDKLGKHVRTRLEHYRRSCYGIVDFALKPKGNLQDAVKALRAAKLEPSTPALFQSTTQSLTPVSFLPLPLPFLVSEAQGWPTLEAAKKHPNGVTGLHSLSVGTREWNSCLNQYRTLLGCEGEVHHYFGKPTCSWLLGDTYLDLCNNAPDGLFSLMLRSTFPLFGSFNPAKTHGVRLQVLGDALADVEVSSELRGEVVLADDSNPPRNESTGDESQKDEENQKDKRYGYNRYG
jgi:hypothetical protein